MANNQDDGIKQLRVLAAEAKKIAAENKIAIMMAYASMPLDFSQEEMPGGAMADGDYQSLIYLLNAQKHA